MIPTDLRETVARALAEDVGRGDRTAALVDVHRNATAVILSREAAILCGTPWFDEVFRQLDPKVRVVWFVREGDAAAPGQALCQLEGSARALLTGERTALNFLQTLSGTATLSRRYAETVTGTPVRILDTRKSIPGLRNAQKYAVRVGGCHNHRYGLDDGILLKENHLMAIGSIHAAVAAARAGLPPGMKVEVEVETLDQVREAIDAQADLILLDNFDQANLAQAVKLCRGKVLTEASGNVNLTTLRAIAETGVDFVSVGALTKDVRAIDLSMRFTLA